MESIKEIALRIAAETDILADESVRFAEALIAEVQKQNEPVAWLCWLDGDTDLLLRDAALVRYEPLAYRNRRPLFTSNQLAAAIAKATKLLEEEVERLKKHQCAPVCIFHEGDEREELKKQLVAAQEEINEWRGKHDVACLTITKLQKQYEIQLAATSKAMGAEESLLIVNYQLAKAEQGAMEWQPIETAPKDGTVFLAWRKHATHPLMVRYEPSYDWFANYDGEHVYDLTHWMPIPEAPNGASS